MTREWVTSEETCPICGNHTEEQIETIGGVEYITGERCIKCDFTIIHDMVLED